jgi:peptidoglycan/LPS O-acetylase OafA/YrhL
VTISTAVKDSLLPPRSLSYRSDIDGLRAFAVLAVVLYHAGFEFFSGGFVGVDVFFVISGYLITSIILYEVTLGEFRVRTFYARRARRLFPALFAVVSCTSIAALFLLMPEELEDYGESAAFTALFSSNFLFSSEAGYFAGPAELKPLLHTWSLAIEEQYYLLFPGFLLLVHRYLNSRFLPCITALFALSFVVSIWSVGNAPDAGFYLLPSRTWELMLGSLLAATPLTLNARVAAPAGWLGFAFILIAVFTFDASTPFPGFSALLPCWGTATVFFAAHGNDSSFLSRMLGLKVIVFFGLISYSLYLWHWPVLVFAKHYLLRDLDRIEAVSLVGLSVLLAIGSWRFIERPFRGPNGILTTTNLFRFSAIGIVATLISGLIFDGSKGLPTRLPDDVRRIAQIANDRPSARRHCEGIQANDYSMARMCRVNDLPVAPSFVLWGDSHAMALMESIGRVAKSQGVNGIVIATNGCAPLLDVARRDLGDECLQRNSAAIDLIAAHPELRSVILHSRWARHAQGTRFGQDGEQSSYLVANERTAHTLEDNQDLYRHGITQTFTHLTELGRKIVVIGSVPEVGYEVPATLAKAKWHGKDWDPNLDKKIFLRRQSFVAEVFEDAAQTFNLHIVEPAKYLCEHDHCSISDPTGQPLYFDDNHLSSLGARRLEPILKHALRSQHL